MPNFGMPADLTDADPRAYRRPPVTAKSASRTPHAEQRSSRAQSITVIASPQCATCTDMSAPG